MFSVSRLQGSKRKFSPNRKTSNGMRTSAIWASSFSTASSSSLSSGSRRRFCPLALPLAPVSFSTCVEAHTACQAVMTAETPFSWQIFLRLRPHSQTAPPALDPLRLLRRLLLPQDPGRMLCFFSAVGGRQFSSFYDQTACRLIMPPTQMIRYDAVRLHSFKVRSLRQKS